jgi:hypothetical protein
MCTRLFLAVLAALALTGGLTPRRSVAADLSKIDRSIRKEPAYRGKPRYCLLVFGPEAATRVWLVQDGGTLYVDRNGNGDLTEPGEKVIAKKDEGAEEGVYSFKIGDLHDGPRTHKDLGVYTINIDHLKDQDKQVKAFLAKHPNGRGYLASIEMELPGWKGTGLGGRVLQLVSVVDVNGVLQFADRPQDAPVVHFGGPWQVTLFGQHRLIRGRETDVVLGVGTPGVGPGTTAYIDYDGVIPTNVYPTLDVEYPPKKPGDPPIREHYELKKRC